MLIYTATMKYPILFYFILVGMSCNPAKEGEKKLAEYGSVQGNLNRIEMFESRYVKSRNIDIWTPSDYSDSIRYRVLYMHDGQMLFDSTISWNKQEWGVDECIQKLLEKDLIEPTIVVGIWNTDLRHSEYLPEKPFQDLTEIAQDSFLRMYRGTGNPLFRENVQSDAYLQFIVQELKPYIDQEYSTLKTREHTFIAGSSMGGLISLYALCEYPDIFGGAACLSTHWPGIFSIENNPFPESMFDYLGLNLPESKDHRIYFDYGTETLDSLYEPFQLTVDSILEVKGYDEESFISLKYEDADHSERSWQKRLHHPVKFLLDRKEWSGINSN